MSDWHLIATDRRVVALDRDGDELVSGGAARTHGHLPFAAGDQPR
jgi:hypothetical protein